MRRKIAAVVATQNPILDKDHPEILEEARYWVHVHIKRNHREKSSVSVVAKNRLRADSGGMEAVLPGLTNRHIATATRPLDMSAALAQLQQKPAQNSFLDVCVAGFPGIFLCGCLMPTSGEPEQPKGGKPRRPKKAATKPKKDTKPLEPKTWEEICSDACACAALKWLLIILDLPLSPSWPRCGFEEGIFGDSLRNGLAQRP